ncbi:hypothetical protein BJ912DRAFT_921926 [Pholiota molesta]|nr:hypothetical protein BJ912DRAFT_921926 [Pholiota molesta]
MQSTGIFGSDFESQLLANNCIGAASFGRFSTPASLQNADGFWPAILYYDYLLTLPMEVSRFWNSRRVTWGSSLFYGNRYLSLIGHIPVMFQYFWTGSDLKMWAVQYNDLESIIGFNGIASTDVQDYPPFTNILQILTGLLTVALSLAVILIMRTYALYGCSKIILLLLCASALAVIAYGIWCVLSQQSPNYTAGDLAPNSCLLPVYDSVYYIFRVRYESLGNLYLKGTTTILTNVISSTMASRLMLNIRDPKLHSNYRTPDNAGRSASLIFTSFIDTEINHELYSRNHPEQSLLGFNGQNFSSHSDTTDIISSMKLNAATSWILLKMIYPMY